MTVILFLVVLAVLILAHEFGHFIVAKKSGMRVDEFGIGFPPRLLKFRRGETDYTINAVPFGGFVKIFGEQGEQGDRSFVSKPKYIQAAVLSAGVICNLILAWALISIGFASGLPTSVAAAPEGATVRDARVMILSVFEGSPAEGAGLIPGDMIVAISAGPEELQSPITTDSVREFIGSHGDENLTIGFVRGKGTLAVSVIPEKGVLQNESYNILEDPSSGSVADKSFVDVSDKYPTGDEARPAIGISMDEVGIVELPIHLAIYEGFKMTAMLTYSLTIAIWQFIASAVTGSASLSQVTGPIGIAGMVGQASEFGFMYLLSFTAFLSINLAIINLIPFPALDGGRLLFLIIETIKRSPISIKVANTLNLIGFFLLMILIIVISYNDIMRLF